MSVSRPQQWIPTTYAVPLVTLLAASFAYAVVVRQLLLWLFGVVALSTLALSAALVYLFYRLVIAVERIADAS